MRLVTKFHSKEQAKRFLAYLIQEKIQGLLESDDKEYSVWIYEEDQIDEALELLNKFSNPEFKEEISQEVIQKEKETGPIPISEDPIFLAQVKEIKAKMQARSLYLKFNSQITKIFILICFFLLTFNVYYHVIESAAGKKVTFTPIDNLLCFDTPVEPGIDSSIVWQGFYPIIENWQKNQSQLAADKFIKIKEGQIWRLFTPCLLHAGLIHLLFNMLWLWMLGKQIEERLPKARYVVLILVLGALSNTCQYLLSGPNFVGFSGVICGLAGFIWMKQKISPWEGYPIPKSSLNFLFIFIFGIGLVQVLSFLLSYMQIVTFPINIANSAHISGLIFGAFLARLHYFDRQKK